MDPAVVPPSGDDIQPVSWADSIDDAEYEALEVVIPSWAVLDFSTVRAEDPNASPPVQRRAENPESFVRREFRQKSKVWRQPAPSSCWRRSPPSGFNKRPERPVGEASPTQRRSPPSEYFPRQERHVREASPTPRRSPPSGFIKRPERPVGEASQTQQRSPPSGFFKRSECTVVEASPQCRSPCSGVFNRQERPVKEASPQENSPPSGSLKKRRPSLALYSPPQCRSSASGSPPSGVFKRPEPAVTKVSPSQHQGPCTNVVSPRDGQKTTTAKSVAQKQEMGGPEMSSIPPTTHTPAPVPERTSPHSGFFKKSLTDAAPLRHQDSSTASSTVNGVRPGEGQKNTTAKRTVSMLFIFQNC
ncbi:proline-rich protein HaeIII subfamily 1-like [Triplophysa rosa]|uniref:proline-rich protein HaeIII subfamily 1-like n=1 Tax=Triplophysa rosa TaxID=992332 RepID=UPI002545DE32|nr:proline-rich protein HaeIII subfamily 1-like [Triplophysa rosa]